MEISLEERVSANETLIVVTINTAYAYFEEDKGGRIEEGKLAYFVVLEDNLLRLEKKAKDIEVMETIKEDESIWKKE